MALNPKAFAFASAAVTVAVDISGYVWHGLLQKPSLMNSLYPGFWSNWTLMIIGLAGTVAAAYALGYLFAWAYNKKEKK
ncbi:MAG: hypothetical protein HYT72_01410 [Candidatus Aenigmarchaeota archaeon]|nr:hypothetical protein [Candidatus Aenigmarchaeota archaeon]